MEHGDFQREVIDRLARIETKQDASKEDIDGLKEDLGKIDGRVTVMEHASAGQSNWLGNLASGGIGAAVTALVNRYVHKM